MTKSDREIMEILEAYDLTGTVWSAAALAGHDPKTVKRYVEARGSGRNPYEREPRPKMIDAFLEKVEQSKATIRADVVHEKLVKMGYRGSALDAADGERGADGVEGGQAPHRPWIPEPGRWMQFDWGEGPRIGGRRTWLFCAWLSWSRFRVVIPVWDCTLGTLLACLDTTLRRIGGAPAHVPTGQRGNGHRRAHRRDPGAAPADGRRRPALRLSGGQLRALRPRIEGRRGGHGREPSARLRLVRRARRYLPDVVRHGELPPP
ncbi:hypothetical protein AB0F46_43045, partial [Streptomyces sp. NPDC026665]